jgi:hypothetical protein
VQLPKAFLAGFTVLLVSPPSTAKEVTAAQACGADRCRPIESRAQVERLHPWGAETKHPGRAAFFRIRFAVRGDGRRLPGYALVYVPSAEVVLQEAPLGNTPWLRAGRARRALRQVTAGLKPIPGGELGRLPSLARARIRRAKARVDENVPPRETSATTQLLIGAIALGLLALAGAGFVVRRGMRS